MRAKTLGLATLFLSIAGASPGLAQEAGLPGRAPTQGLAHQGAAEDPSLAAARALSERMAAAQDVVLAAVRMRGLLRDAPPGGIDATAARLHLGRNGAPADRVSRQVALLMAADTDGNGRVTSEEFNAHLGRVLSKGMDAVNAFAPARDRVGLSGEGPSGVTSGTGPAAARVSGVIGALLAGR